MNKNPILTEKLSRIQRLLRAVSVDFLDIDEKRAIELYDFSEEVRKLIDEVNDENFNRNPRKTDKETNTKRKTSIHDQWCGNIWNY
jgi:hypothetical protein